MCAMEGMLIWKWERSWNTSEIVSGKKSKLYFGMFLIMIIKLHLEVVNGAHYKIN